MAGAGGREVGRISIRVVPDLDRFYSDLKAKLEEVEKKLKGNVEVDVDLNDKGVKAKFDVLMDELKVKGRKGVTIKTDIDRKGLAGLSGLSGLGGGAGSLGGMGHGLAIVAAVAALAAPALALISGALASIPALAAALIVPIGAIALGLDGLKKAAGVLKGPMDGLKKVMSQKFQDVFTPIFTAAIPLFDAMKGSLPAVAQALGDVAQSFVGVVTSAPGLDKIKGIISNIAAFISSTAPGIGKLTDGLLGLANGVSAKFPAVGKWIDSVGDSFSRWVDKVSKDGSLDRAMGNLGDTLKPVLDLLGDLAKTGFNWLQDPKFAQSMKTFVGDLRDLVNNVLPGLGSFFSDLTTTLDQLGTVLSEINKLPGAKDFTSEDRTHPKNKDGTPTDTSNFFEPFTSKDAPWRQFGPELSKLWDTISADTATHWGQITGYLSSQFDLILLAATTDLSAVGGFFSGLWSSISSGAQSALSGIGGLFNSIPGQLAGAWSSLAGIASGAWQAVSGAVSSAWESIKAAVSAGVAAVISFVSGMGGKIISAITSINLSGAGTALMNGLLAGIKAGAQAVYNFVSGIAGKIAALKGPLSYDKTVLTPNGQALMQGLQDGIEGGLQGVLDRAKQIAGQISDAINSGTAGTDLGALPKQLTQSLAELNLESKQLKVQLNGTTDKGQRTSIQDQMKQLQALKDQLGLQKDQLGYSQKYGDQTDQNTKSTDYLGQSLSKGGSIIHDFVEANVKQFGSDIGIQGNGAVEAGLNYGLQFLGSLFSGVAGGGGKSGGNTTIQVNSVDEALAAKQNITNKQALQYKTR